MKVLELFSGIGGMHFACKEAEKLSNAQLVLDVVTAVDINTSANTVYRANFPDTKLLGRNIQALSVEDVVKLSPEVVLMSPPCQPFTRTGLKKDLTDARCDALSYLLQVLPHIPSLKYLLLENVKGFEQSQSRDLFTQMLIRAGFKFQELLLSPTQFGVPNSRTRYYLIAKKCDTSDKSTSVGDSIDNDNSSGSNNITSFCFETSNELITALPKLKDRISVSPAVTNMTLQSILDTTDDTDTLYQKYRVPEKDLVRRFNVLDIVSSGQIAACTNCFTKAYTHYAEGTGSVLSNLENNTLVEEIIQKAKNLLRKHKHSDNTEESTTKKQKLHDRNDSEETDIQKETKQDSCTTEMKDIQYETSNKEVSDGRKEHAKKKNQTEEETISDKGSQENDKDKISSIKNSRIEDSNAKRTESSEVTTSTNKIVVSSATITTRDDAEILSELSKLNLRYFSPNEIRKLMCFPDSFIFPMSCTDKAKYKLLGNSINVHVVAYCICLMLLEGDH